MKTPDEALIYSGKTFEVEFYVTEIGRSPGYEYYLGLSEEVRRRFLVMIGHFADAPIGTILPKTIMNIEDKADGIYAFKPNIHRFFGFFAKGKKIVILNGYQKHSQKMTKIDKETLNSAKRMKADYERRTKAGIYYG